MSKKILNITITVDGKRLRHIRRHTITLVDDVNGRRRRGKNISQGRDSALRACTRTQVGKIFNHIVRCQKLGQSLCMVYSQYPNLYRILYDGTLIAYKIYTLSKPMEKVKNEIKALYNGSLKKPHNVAKEYPALYLRARKVFGSWKKALEACGIDYEKARNHKKWSRVKVIEEINKLYLNNGHGLRLKELRRRGMICLISAAMYHFGSWRKAVESCGICYSFGKGKKGIKDEQIRSPDQ